MPVTKERPGPYAPASAILSTVRRHRDRGLPNPVDSEVLGRAGISPSLIPRTLQAMQALDLIGEDGRITETLEGLRLAPEAEYKDRMRQWLTVAYADALQFVDPATDDETKIRDAFRSYSPTGQQDRMVSLFVGLFTAADIMPERSKAVPVRSKVMRTIPAAAAPRYRQTVNPAPRVRQQPRQDALIGALPPALAGLMVSLPSAEVGWTQAERDKFFTAFGVMLDFCFPIVEPAPAQTETAHDL